MLPPSTTRAIPPFIIPGFRTGDQTHLLIELLLALLVFVQRLGFRFRFRLSQLWLRFRLRGRFRLTLALALSPGRCLGLPTRWRLGLAALGWCGDRLGLWHGFRFRLGRRCGCWLIGL